MRRTAPSPHTRSSSAAAAVVAALVGIAAPGCGGASTPPAAPAEPPSPLLAPTGRAPVGRHAFVLETAARQGDRALLVDVWYPAASADGPRAPYSRPGSGLAAALAQLLGIDAAELPPLEGVPTHAAQDAPIAPGRHPVVVLAPGWGGPNNQNTMLAEELASHGFAVAAVAFTGESVLVERPDGTRVPIDPALVARFLGEAGEAAPHFAAWMAASDPAERARHRAAFTAASPFAQERAAAWIEDLGAVVAALGAPRGPLGSGLDPARLAIAGMSFGGGIAAAACAKVPACRASIALDGFAPGAGELAPVRPHLVVEAPPGGTSDHLLAAAAPVWRLRVAGTAHLDYTDMAVLAPRSSLRGTIDGTAHTRWLRDTVRGFLGCALAGGPAWQPRPAPGIELATSAAAAAAPACR